MLRVAVIGCKGIGIQHATGVAGVENATVVAGCDLDEGTRESFKEHWSADFPDLALYADHREMLADAAPDIVTVATSDHRHADLVVDSANARVKGVFCEKPLATSVQDADRMVEACAANGTILSVDHTRRWQPLWRHVHENVIGAGDIGDVQYVIGTLNGPRAMLFRNGTHLIDSLCWFAGSTPQWVFAELEDGYDDYHEYKGDGGHDPKTEPSASGYIHFANGVRAFYGGGTKSGPDPKFRLEIVGSDGYILIDDRRATLIKGGELTDIDAPTWDVTGIPAGVQELIALVADGGEPISPGTEAAKTVEIFMGFLESQRRGNARVELPLPRG